MPNGLRGMQHAIGNGYDIHRLGGGWPLIWAVLRLDSSRFGLDGHS